MMIGKIKTINYRKYVRELRDVRVIGMFVFGGVVLLVTWSGIGVIQTNYDLQKKIARLQQEVDLDKLENSNLKLRNQYFNTDQFLELQARRQFGKAAPGEKLLIVPKSVALAHATEINLPNQTKTETQTAYKPFYQRNLEAWVDFLFRRPEI